MMAKSAECACLNPGTVEVYDASHKFAHGAAVVLTRVLNNLNAFGALAITTDPSACYC